MRWRGLGADEAPPDATGATGGRGDDARPPRAGGETVKGGILRIGTINYIDSLNPFNYIESQAYQAMIMIYPQLVQYDAGTTGSRSTGDWADVVGDVGRTARTGRSTSSRARSGRTARR